MRRNLPSASLGLAVFHHLCAAGNALEALRNTCSPGSDAWVALCELMHGVDTLIDTLVESPPLEEDERCADAPRA